MDGASVPDKLRGAEADIDVIVNAPDMVERNVMPGRFGDYFARTDGSDIAGALAVRRYDFHAWFYKGRNGKFEIVEHSGVPQGKRRRAAFRSTFFSR